MEREDLFLPCLYRTSKFLRDRRTETEGKEYGRREKARVLEFHPFGANEIEEEVRQKVREEAKKTGVLRMC